MLVGNEHSSIVHMENCEYAWVIAPVNFVMFEELDHALSQGYRCCRACFEGRDWELSSLLMKELSGKAFGQCIVCKETRGVQKAHVIPRRFGGTQLIPLCPLCHWNYDHNLLDKRETGLLQAYISKHQQL